MHDTRRGSQAGLANPRGFTLVELLVATAVMAVFLVLSAQVVSTSLSQWSLANDRMAAHMQARLALDWLARDTQSLMIRSDDSEWLRISPEMMTGHAGQTFATSRLLMFCQPGERPKDPGAPSTRISGPVAVAYAAGFLDPMVSGGTRKKFALLRTAINPRDTFDNMAVGNLETDFWASGVLGFTAVRPEDIIAENVVGFTVVAEFLDESTGTVHRSDPAQLFTVGPQGAIRAGSASYPRARLTSLEFSLLLLTQKTASRLDTLTGALWQSSLDSAEPYSKRLSVLAP